MSRRSPIRDYTGVATRDLREVILRQVPDISDNVEAFSRTAGYSSRHITAILNQERPFTSLVIADTICHNLGLLVTVEMPIIPAAGFAACCRMAADELWVRDEGVPTQEEIHRRAHELAKLRDTVLGDLTPDQQHRVEIRQARDRLRWQQKVAKAAA